MNHRIRYAVAACIACVPTGAVFAADAAEGQGLLDEVVVSASRAGEGIPRGLLGSSVTIIDPIDMENRQVRYLSDVLRDVPGVAVSRGGSVGGLTQVRIRGTEGNHTLVLIDGMEASDPYFGEFDFGTLIADDVGRVEVLRGQQSALYGSDAIGGVVQYFTLSGREAPGARVRLEGGSFGSLDGAARFAGEAGPLDYSLSGGWQKTDGYPTSRFGTRDVGTENGVLSGRFVWTVSDAFRVKAVGRANRTEGDTNDQNFSFGSPNYGFIIDSDDYYRNRALYGLVRAEHDAFEGRWQNALQVQGVDAERKSFSGGLRGSSDEGSRRKITFESTVHFGSDDFKHNVTFAADDERETFQNTGPGINAAQALKRHIDNLGLVAQYEFVAKERIGFGAALRRDENDGFDNINTYRVHGSYRFDTGTRVRAATGSGIKNPTPTEQFGFNPNTFIGNPNLKPEKSKGWEAGVEQQFADGRALLGVTYFNNELENEIFTVFSGPNFVSSPSNRLTLSKQKGVEVIGQARIGEAWRVDAAYTHLNAKENNVEEVRRPPTTGSLNVAWSAPTGRFGLNATVRYNGDMLDSNFTGVGPSRVTLDAYTLVNIGGDWQVNEKVQVYARVENLLDEKYEEVYTYATAGTGGYAGVRVKF